MSDCIIRQAQKTSFGALIDVRTACHLAVIADELGVQARITLATELHAASIVTKTGSIRS